MKLPDRQRLDECRPHFRSDDEEPVRLAVIRGEFGEELVVGDAGRSGELGFGADPCADFFRDLSSPRLMPLRFSVTSRYASSSDKGSMIGVYAAKISRICRETAL